jgi:hypothetical protein
MKKIKIFMPVWMAIALFTEKRFLSNDMMSVDDILVVYLRYSRHPYSMALPSFVFRQPPTLWALGKNKFV